MWQTLSFGDRVKHSILSMTAARSASPCPWFVKPETSATRKGARHSGRLGDSGSGCRGSCRRASTRGRGIPAGPADGGGSVLWARHSDRLGDRRGESVPRLCAPGNMTAWSRDGAGHSDIPESLRHTTHNNRQKSSNFAIADSRPRNKGGICGKNEQDIH